MNRKGTLHKASVLKFLRFEGRFLTALCCVRLVSTVSLTVRISVKGETQHLIRPYLFIHLGGERQCSKTRHTYPARARTRKTRPENERTNHKATAPKTRVHEDRKTAKDLPSTRKMVH